MDNWLPSLIVARPTEGYDPALKRLRMRIKKAQPNAAVPDRLRPAYANALIAAAVLPTHFATTAAANGFSRSAP